MWDFCNATLNNVPITSKLLQVQNIFYGMELNLDNFPATNGWLEAFQKCHGIKTAVLSGEAADVSYDNVKNRKSHLMSVCNSYKAKNVFNADETGLCFHTVPSQIIVFIAVM